MGTDLKGSLVSWLASVDAEELAEWFKNPDDIELYAKTEWKDVLTEFFQKEVARAAAPELTVFALTGLMDLFDFLHVFDLIESLEVCTVVAYLEESPSYCEYEFLRY